MFLSMTSKDTTGLKHPFRTHCDAVHAGNPAQSTRNPQSAVTAAAHAHAHIAANKRALLLLVNMTTNSPAKAVTPARAHTHAHALSNMNHMESQAPKTPHNTARRQSGWE